MYMPNLLATETVNVYGSNYVPPSTRTVLDANAVQSFASNVVVEFTNVTNALRSIQEEQGHVMEFMSWLNVAYPSAVKDFERTKAVTKRLEEADASK